MFFVFFIFRLKVSDFRFLVYVSLRLSFCLDCVNHESQRKKLQAVYTFHLILYTVNYALKPSDKKEAKLEHLCENYFVT